MQHNKITDNLGEFQKFVDSDSNAGMCLEDTIKFFDIQRIFGQFEFVKQSCIRVTMIMSTLLLMLFYRSRNIQSYFSRQQGRQLERDGSKKLDGAARYFSETGNNTYNLANVSALTSTRRLVPQPWP